MRGCHLITFDLLRMISVCCVIHELGAVTALVCIQLSCVVHIITALTALLCLLDESFEVLVRIGLLHLRLEPLLRGHFYYFLLNRRIRVSYFVSRRGF